MKLRQQWLQRNLGGGGNTGAQQIASAPTPAAIPPITTTNAEVVQAQNDLRRQSLQKRGFGRNTILAGDSGGYFPAATKSPTTNPQFNSPAFPITKTLGG